MVGASADGTMSFHTCNGITAKTIDIIEDRHINNLIKYFYYYDYKARNCVKFIIIDMYSPYVSLIKKMFPNASIIISLPRFTFFFKNKNYSLLHKILNNYNFKISSYLKTSIKTLKEFLIFIKNTFLHKYHNGFIEGNNNFIKVIKRIAFDFRSFRRFKTRIMICKDLLKIKK